MMLSVLVWLAMWGQVQAQTTYGQRSYCVIGKNFASNCTQAEIDEYTWANGSPIEDIDSQTWGWPKSKPRKAKPAEHVIEIKTVREDHHCDVDKVGAAEIQCEKDGFAACKGDPLTVDNRKCWNSVKSCDASEQLANDYHECKDSERVTRELWIDGQKFGVVKGLE